MSGPRKAGLWERLRYRFDNSMARGPSALIVYLAAATAILVLIFAVFVLIASTGPTRNGVTAIYNALLHVIDPGTVTADDTSSPGFIVLQLLLTFGGIIIFSAFVGVLATTFDQWLTELRKGRSDVLEHDHTLVLGWSDTIFTILSELAISNENETDPSVVILADRDKVEMEDAIRQKVPDLRGTRVVCRTGSTIDLKDLGIVNPNDARAIIVLSPDEDEPDASVIKTILAITRGPDRRERPFHIVAEIENTANLEVARLVGGTETVLIDKAETVARIIVQTARQSGAAAVYTELLDFDGDEVYFRRDEAWEGRRYDEALMAYEDCAVIGYQHEGKVHLNPLPGTLLPEACELIAIAEDDANLLAATAPSVEIDAAAMVPTPPLVVGPQRTLIIGVNARTATVIRELDQYVEVGSSVVLVAAREVGHEQLLTDTGPLQHLEVEIRRGSTTSRRALESLDVPSFDNVIAMCYSDLDTQRADAMTLITLLHLRDICDRVGSRIPIVSEMLDDGNRSLAQVTKVDDVIVSDHVVSLLLSQISENPHLAQVFQDLFDAAGSEVYLRDATSYVKAGAEVSFATLVVSAARNGETAIGYRRAVAFDDPDQNFGVTVNPKKSRVFATAPGDRLIVLAED